MARNKSQPHPKPVKYGEGIYVELDGVPVDVTGGMFAEPEGRFVSKHQFGESDLHARMRAVDWFGRCGQPPRLDLTMPVERVKSWAAAAKSCTSRGWDNTKIDAENQLTEFLSENDSPAYQKWNRIVIGHTKKTVEPLIKKRITPFASEHGLGPEFDQCVRGDLRMVLMEHSYLGSGHGSFFFHELFMVYEAGHLPCGWKGRWPTGKLLVF